MPINLLPTDLSPKGPVVKIAGFIRSIAVISFSALLITGLGISAFFVVNSLQIKNTNTRNEQLKASIQSLETTEQSVVLVRDRLSKVKQILVQDTGGDETQGLANFINQIPPDVQLAEAIIAKNGVETTFLALSSSSLTQLMAGIISQEDFVGIELVSFSFNPNAGYVVSFDLRTK